MFRRITAIIKIARMTGKGLYLVEERFINVLLDIKNLHL
jgi:hypothetical protein